MERHALKERLRQHAKAKEERSEKLLAEHLKKYSAEFSDKDIAPTSETRLTKEDIKKVKENARQFNY
jgi:hypothetical protein